MSSKNLFNKQKELRDQLAAVVHADWFKQCLVFIRGELMELPNMTTEQLKGAKSFEMVLLDFTDEEPDLATFPTPGIRHDLDARRGVPETKEE